MPSRVPMRSGQPDNRNWPRVRHAHCWSMEAGTCLPSLEAPTETGICSPQVCRSPEQRHNLGRPQQSMHRLWGHLALTRPVSLRLLQAKPDCDQGSARHRPKSQGSWEGRGGSAGVRGERGLLGKGGVKGHCMQVRDKTVGRVMHFLHAVLPDEPEEGAKGPLSHMPGLAEGTSEGGTVRRHVIKRPEGKQRKPDWGGPQPGLG